MSGYINKTFKWRYVDRKKHTREWYWTLSIPRDLYETFVKSPHTIYANTDFIRFVTSPKDESFFQIFANKLKAKAKKVGYSQLEIAEWILNMVGSIPYAKDPGHEYPRYPIETLWDGGGDCEDAAILLAKILLSIDYEVALILFPHHAAVGIHFPQNIFLPNGVYYELYGKEYYFADAAGSYWIESGHRRIGQMAENYRKMTVTILPIPSHK